MKTKFRCLFTLTLCVTSLLCTSYKDDIPTDQDALQGERIEQIWIFCTNYVISNGISVDWNNWTDGENYNVAMAISDFGDINNFTHDEQARTLISLSRLRVSLIKNEYGASGGVITNSHINDNEGYEINYRVKFHSHFRF